MYRNPNKPQKSDVHKMKKPPNKNIKEEEHWSLETVDFKSEKLENRYMKWHETRKSRKAKALSIKNKKNYETDTQ